MDILTITKQQYKNAFNQNKNEYNQVQPINYWTSGVTRLFQKRHVDVSLRNVSHCNGFYN